MATLLWYRPLIIFGGLWLVTVYSLIKTADARRRWPYWAIIGLLCICTTFTPFFRVFVMMTLLSALIVRGVIMFVPMFVKDMIRFLTTDWTRSDTE